MPDLLSALLTDVVPRAATGYLIADGESGVVDALRERVDDLQVLTSLEGDLEPRSVVVMLSFGPRSRSDLDVVTRLVEPGGTMVLLSAGEDVIAALLGADGGTLAPADRPRSADQVRRALTSPGRPSATVHLLFGSADAPRVILTDDVAVRAQPGDLPTALVAGALTRDEVSVDDALDALVRCGGLDLAAAGWVAVVGGAGRDIYHLTSDGEATGRTATRGPRSGTPRTAELAAGVSLEQTLRDVLAAQDVPAFRELAARVGSWVRTEPGASARPVIAFDQLTFSDGHLRWTLPDAAEQGDGSADAALTAGWQRFLGRLHARRENLPWPSLSTDAELVRSWARMSGVERPEPAERDHAEDEIGLLVAAHPSARTDGPAGGPDRGIDRSARPEGRAAGGPGGRHPGPAARAAARSRQRHPGDGRGGRSQGGAGLPVGRPDHPGPPTEGAGPRGGQRARQAGQGDPSDALSIRQLLVRDLNSRNGPMTTLPSR